MRRIPEILSSHSRFVLAILVGLLPGLTFVDLCEGGPLAADDSKPMVRFDLRAGDHVSLIGNTLADRMQHDGWLETFIYSRFPKHDLVFRNLGFAGDELTIRLRSANFGSPDQHLTRNKADVVFAFFGYNESFAGQEGLGKFKKDLDEFIKHTLTQKYNGKSAPRLVIFSPIAQEPARGRDLPDGVENNKRLVLYTDAMRDVSQRHGVPFVDLFAPTREQYAKASSPLTINGIHLTADGDRLLAQVIDKALFSGQPEPKRDPQALESLR
ncbi:MAG TPA: SGNH/GDSL hydrolase family protein, partial [Isosphaeraceae bacterium]|nr:SGNH/GDSL hydrolase family protein [Isosphaeraceae bacterium]